jgi:hypothetical protein
MAALVINSIVGTPALATRNSVGSVLQPGVATTLWDMTGSYVDGTGSTKPATFKTPADNTSPYSPALTVNATITFTSQYSGNIFNVEGYLVQPDGTSITILNSTGNMPPSPLPNPPLPVQMQFSNFQFDARLNLANGCPVPFRCTGDFRWKLTFTTLPGKII